MIVGVSQTAFVLAAIVVIVGGIIWLLCKPFVDAAERNQRDNVERRDAAIRDLINQADSQEMAQRAIDAARSAKASARKKSKSKRSERSE